MAFFGLICFFAHHVCCMDISRQMYLLYGQYICKYRIHLLWYAFSFVIIATFDLKGAWRRIMLYKVLFANVATVNVEGLLYAKVVLANQALFEVFFINAMETTSKASHMNLFCVAACIRLRSCYACPCNVSFVLRVVAWLEFQV